MSTHGYTSGERSKNNPKWRAHVAWCRLRERCERPRGDDRKNYAGRGITYDSRWSDFEAFVSDMGLPEPGETLDRIDNNGPYSPSNCRWASREVQSRNRRNNNWIEFNGKRQLVGDWARELGVPVQRLKNRLHRGWTLEKALTPNNYNTDRKP